MSDQDIVELWLAEGVLPPDVAARRVSEVLHVAVADGGGLAGVTTAYIARNEQLRMDLWHLRAFVATEHRMTSIALDLLRASRDHLEERFVTGADTRAAGMALVIANKSLQHHNPHGNWRRAGVAFIGVDERGDWVRVRYFPGALAPGPEDG